MCSLPCLLLVRAVSCADLPAPHLITRVYLVFGSIFARVHLRRDGKEIVMAVISSSVTTRRGRTWMPRWLRRQREAREMARWTTEVSWQWLDAVDSAQLARHSH